VFTFFRLVGLKRRVESEKGGDGIKMFEKPCDWQCGGFRWRFNFFVQRYT